MKAWPEPPVARTRPVADGWYEMRKFDVGLHDPAGGPRWGGPKGGNQ